MNGIKKNYFTKWEVSIIKIEDENEIRYKVTRRLAEMSVSETKLFKNLDEAKRQFEEWLK
jgi:muramoyltetrapeptide carboxypeptidase LdcA involved in peptidoglycan recycling